MQRVSMQRHHWTDVVAIKPPIPPNEPPTSNRLLLLPQPKVHLCLMRGLPHLGPLQMQSVAIALIFTVDVDEHSEAFGNVAFGGQVDAEGLWPVGHGDERFDQTVAVDGAVLFKFEARLRPLDLACNLSETGHSGKSLIKDSSAPYCSDLGGQGMK